MEKGNFIKLIESIKRQRDNDVSCSEKLSEVFGCFVLYDNDAIICGIIDFLRAELKDEDDWIGYYIMVIKRKNYTDIVIGVPDLMVIANGNIKGSIQE